MNKITFNQIAEAMRAGRFADAERLCRTSFEQVHSSDDTDVLFLFALSLHYQGKVHEALDIYLRLTRLQPESGVHWNNYATALHEAGQYEAAESAFEQALAHPPVEASTLLNFGLLLLRRESYRRAQEVLLRAHAMEPDSGEIGLAAARASDACKDPIADQILAKWRDWPLLNDEMQLQLSKLLLVGGREVASARELAEDVSRRSPENRQAKIQLADIYERLNRLDDAENLLTELNADSVLEGWARCEVDHQRATLALRRGEPGLAKSLLVQAGERYPGDATHYFELARICDRLKEYDAVVQALECAHSLQLAEIKQVAPHLVGSTDSILPQGNARITAQDYEKWPRLISPEQGQSPVFVVGFPRSGTTLLEQMLDSHPRLQSMDERPFFNILAQQLRENGLEIPEDLGSLSQRDCDELRKGYVSLACSKVPRRWDARLVDKNPLNMLWLPMIHRIFPNAKWILALRHPCDVIWSCYMQQFRASVLAAACATLERLARAYVEAMKQWLFHCEVFKPDVLVSRYETLVAEPAEQAERIAEFLQLNDGLTMLHFDQRAREKGFIATPSYSQVVEPINTKALGRWKRYRREFDSLLPILQPMLEHWGYDAA